MSANTGSYNRLKAVARIGDLTVQSVEAIVKGNRDEKSINSFLVILQQLKDDQLNKVDYLGRRLKALFEPFRETEDLRVALAVLAWFFSSELQYCTTTPQEVEKIAHGPLHGILGAVACILERIGTDQPPNGVYLSDTLRFSVGDLAKLLESDLPQFVWREDQAEAHGKARLRNV